MNGSVQDSPVISHALQHKDLQYQTESGSGQYEIDGKNHSAGWAGTHHLSIKALSPQIGKKDLQGGNE